MRTEGGGEAMDTGKILRDTLVLIGLLADILDED